MSASPVAASRIGGGMGEAGFRLCFGEWCRRVLRPKVEYGPSDRVAMPARMPVGLVAAEDILPPQKNLIFSTEKVVNIC